MESQLEQFIDKVPKAELHLHLEGCIQLDTLWLLYQKNDVQIEGVSDKAGLAKLYQINSLQSFIDFFIHVLQNCVRHAEDIRYYLHDLQDYLRRNNVRYAELFFAPSKLLQSGIDYCAIADILQKGAEELAAEGFLCHFLIDVSRSFGPQNAMRNLEAVLAHRRPAILGIGLGGLEEAGPAGEYQQVFAKARANGLHCVAHAGEDIGPKSIWDTLELLQIERIGHGLSAMQDPLLRAELKRRKVPLEVCITSNTFTRHFITEACQHPVRLFYDEGLAVTLNSDDPALFGSDLCNEYKVLVKDCGFRPKELLQIMQNNIMYSFMPKEQQARFMHKVRKMAQEFQLL